MPATDIAAPVPVTPADLGALRRHPGALTALGLIVQQARREGRDRVPPSARFARGLLAGYAVARSWAEAQIGPDGVAALVGVGAMTETPDEVALGFCVVFLREIAVAYPHRQPADHEAVYVGTEAPWLIRLAWDVGPVPNGDGAVSGGAMADLATGTGVIAAAMSARYRTVIATDLTPRTVDCAALTLALNRAAGRTSLAVCADVADGLRHGAFDLVVGNPPWVPDRGPTGSRFLYAGGGRTGMELPARFISQTTELLAPGGVGVLAVLDSRWEDGSRPLAAEIDALGGRGFHVDVRPAPETAWSTVDESELVSSVPGCVGGTLVALVIRRA